MTSTRFRIQSKNFSVTWPRSDFNLEDAMMSLRQKRHVQSIILCSETHEDGSFHRHASIRFSKRIDIRNPRYFDLFNRHANIQATENVARWESYVRSDGDFIEWTSDETTNPTCLFTKAREMSHENYFNWCVQNSISFGYANYAWSSVNNERSDITFTEDPNVTLSMPLPRNLSNYSLDTSLTNVIVGESGCGKTTYALRHALKPTLFLTHLDQLKHLTSDIRSIVFDDMNFSHLPLQAQIHLVDRQLPRAIHRRYGTTLIPSGIQVIMTCNERPLTWHPAIERRINYIQIY